MKVVIRKDAGIVSCPTLGQVSRRLNRCQFTLCYQFERPRSLFPLKPGEDSVSGMVPDWVELRFPDAVMERDKLRIVTIKDANEVYRAYLDSPNNNPREAEAGILAILDHSVYAVIDSDNNSIVQLCDSEDSAKSRCASGNERLYRDRYVVRDIGKRTGLTD